MAIHDAVSGEWFYQDAGSGEGIKLIATSVRLALPSLSYKQGGGGGKGGSKVYQFVPDVTNF